MIRIRKPYRENRTPEVIRRKRQIRRARNLLFLIIFLGMFGLGFNRVIAYEKSLFWLLFGIAGDTCHVPAQLPCPRSVRYIWNGAAITTGTLSALVLAWCMSTILPIN
ncbi:MAG TPA: hypothetical protein VED37_18915 [Ktedonobacteraceae bacterium]|nr:hypothetical protein [Ktedonobacteraceae bacterium]